MSVFLRISRGIFALSQRLLVVALILTIPAATSTPQPTNVEPALRQLAVAEPDTVVAMIVQKTAPLPVEAQVIKLGGRITKDLSLINAFVTELPARHLAQVAQLAGVRWVSLDAPVVESACPNCIDTTRLVNVYNQSIGADQLWNQPPYLQGQGVGIAVLDSGIQTTHADIAGRVVSGKSIIPSSEMYDGYGHGTFVAGLIAGNGATQQGRYIGVAPRSQLINVKVTTVTGASTESDVIAGLQWVYENRAAYNIRVVNLSLNASRAQSYHTSPLSAACEILWFNGVVVVTSAGNRGADTIYPPASDPFVITVGAADDMGTPSISDDKIASFSAYGVTKDGVKKPDLIAPGRYIVGPRALASLLTLLYPKNVVDRNYIRISGTSAAAPIVSGAIALLLQNEPQLTPDQVKHRLLVTANRQWTGYEEGKAGAGYLDIAAAVRHKSKGNANTGIAVSRLLSTGSTPITQLLNPAIGHQWDSVSWSSVSWSSVSWSSVSWSSVSWSSDYMQDNAPLPPLAQLPTIGAAAVDDAALLAEIDAMEFGDLMEIKSQVNANLLPNRLFLPLVLQHD